MAVGDGYNDTPMLVAADCGVRLVSPQSKQNQTEKDSDFVISQFCQLGPLIFSHGFYCNRQISNLIYVYFYKNILLVICAVMFQLNCGFSLQIFFPRPLTGLFNLYFTTFPFIVAVVTEHRGLFLESKAVDPQKYQSMREKHFGAAEFWKWICFATVHGVLIYTLCMVGYQSFSSESQQKSIGLNE